MTYEMLIGEPPHTGPTVQAVIARVLTDTPRRVRIARPAVPAARGGGHREGVGKASGRPFATAAQLVDAIQNPGSTFLPSGNAPSETGAAASARVGRERRTRWRTGAAVLAGVVAGVGISAGVVMLRPSTTPPTIRFSMPIKANPGCFAVSPDNSSIAFDGGAKTRQLYTRRFADEAARPIAGTEGVRGCFFSPDGEWIGFWSDGRLQKVRVSGGPALAIANVERFTGASWGKKDIIVFSAGTSGLWQVEANGGTPRQFTSTDPSQGVTSHRYPTFLPDGETVLFNAWIAMSNTRIGIASLDGRSTMLDVFGLSPQYLDGNRVLFARGNGTAFMASFDPRRRVLTSSPALVLDEVDARTSGSVGLSVTPSGTLAYMRGRPASVLVLVGTAGEQIIPIEPRRMRHRVSHQTARASLWN